MPPASDSESTSYPGKTLGVVGLVLAFFAPLIGLILSAVALHQSKKVGRTNAPALIGTILGAVFTVMGMLIMALLVLTTFSGVQSKARDTERQSDINALSARLEAYYADKQVYPASLDALKDSGPVDQTIFVGPQGEGYSYQAAPAGCTTSCSSYVLSATLEDGQLYTRKSLTY